MDLTRFYDQTRDTPWRGIDLEKHIQAVTESPNPPQTASGMPTLVVLLLEGEEFDPVKRHKLDALRWYVEQGLRPFALGNQPAYVVEAVENHVLSPDYSPLW